MSTSDSPENRQAKLNRETASIAWRELQRFFATGKAVFVSPNIDLLDVAEALLVDDSTKLKQWMSEDLVHPVSDTEASNWYDKDAFVWPVVISPWVLVQPK
ncbi:DUF2288 domain-containing protein [Teredinibacter haidensis]|uniref:DUF2288 domain-containing protein n=1 Tax=Teredinibacter haidensis TaxID=2731755 RepID=UPI0009490E3F|nr:DUF2288 domain-containing protein [Teredinibacter haidensis]